MIDSKTSEWHKIKGAKWPLMLAALLFGLFLQIDTYAFTFTLNVVDQNGNAVSGFRWLVEEDTTQNIVPGTNQLPAETVKLSNHRSYAPVAAEGRTAGSSAAITVADGKRYFVSVLPDSGHTMSGAMVANGQQAVTVRVATHPVPTAQISVFVFHDYNPINNAPDVGEEGIQGFRILVFDQAGQQAADAFGNQLGTTYQQNPDGSFVLDPDGNPVVQTPGGDIYTGAKGEARIRYLAPGKYGIRAVPRGPNTLRWVQTTTIEGTPGIDSWVRANEPSSLIEFGRAFWHVFFGFIYLPHTDINGNNVLNNLGTLPNPSGNTGTITGRVINVHQPRPPSTQLYNGVPVPEAWVALNVDQGAVPTRGVYAAPCNPDSTFSIPNVPPGTYQLVMWDFPQDQIIAFRTVIVPDIPGPNVVPMGDIPINAWFGRLEGTVFYDIDGDGFRDPGEVGISGQAVNLRFRDGTIYQATATDANGNYKLVEVFPWFKWIVVEVDFLRFKDTGYTNVVDNGDAIPPASGVMPATAAWTMPSENKRNPQPQAQVNPNTGNNLSRTDSGGGPGSHLLQAMLLYADQNHRIDWGKQPYGSGENGGIAGIVFYDTTRAEDDPRYNAGETWQPGIPNVTVRLYRIEGRDASGKPNRLTLINEVQTDSWDANMPTDCLGDPQFDLLGNPIDPCAETLRTWNQLRPGVFDGGYAFTSYWNPSFGALGALEVDGLPAGSYVVEVVPPTGYKVVKEEDKNIDFGDSLTPSTLALPAVCVGPDHLVPAELSLFPGVPGAFAGQTRPLCTMKEVEVIQGRNTPADFFLFTEVPKAARIIGLITNDLANTFNPNDPNAAEKLSPVWIPVSFKDYLGNEVARVYGDRYGGYNALLPSTYTVNVPNPSGVSPNMIKIVLNDPGPDPANPDPFYNPGYSTTSYNMDVWPGKTTYADTPVIPTNAFSASFTSQLDCQLPDGTPRIREIINGPYVSGSGETVSILAVGSALVPNPFYDSTQPIGPANPIAITRDYGFGTDPGTVTVGGVPLSIVTWNSGSIIATVPVGVSTGQLEVRRGDNGLSSVVGITLTVGGPAPIRVPVDYLTIQAAIDAASPGSLILVSPGTYIENLIMWKPVALQGSGETTIINGGNFDTARENAWLAKVNSLVLGGQVTLVPGQREDFFLERGAGVTVLGKTGAFMDGRIDGFTITRSLISGGIFVNGYTDGLEISNNRIVSNYGNFAGGIRIGWPSIPDGAGGYRSSSNTDLYIHNNQIMQNGTRDGAGGISLFNGSDNYTLVENNLCGNLSMLQGAGIHHLGLSDNALIMDNTIIFNEVNTGDKPIGGQGGGILIAGETPAAGQTLSPGAGTVGVVSNLIQGNIANHDGGGISILRFNGRDVQNNPGNPAAWHALRIYNNIIANNVSQMAGGGISLSAVARGEIIHNTIPRNDSTASNQDAFAPGATISAPQVAGLVSRAHSTALSTALGGAQTFSNPVLANNIIWENRSFMYNGALNSLQPVGFSDLGVTGTAGTLTPVSCMLSGQNPVFVASYYNQLSVAAAPGEGGNFLDVLLNPLTLTGDYHIQPVSPAVDAGNNAFIANFPALLGWDFDGEARPIPNPGIVDIGADELSFAPPSSASPVHRFYSPVYGSHFFTISEAEKEFVMTTWPTVWSYEGKAWYAYTSQQPGTLPVYRFWSPVLNNVHFYTISAAERAYIIATWPGIWVEEGVAFYAYPTQQPGTMAVYRFWSPVFEAHFFTISAAERAYINATWPGIYTDEGVAFYAFLPIP